MTSCMNLYLSKIQLKPPTFKSPVPNALVSPMQKIGQIAYSVFILKITLAFLLYKPFISLNTLDLLPFYNYILPVYLCTSPPKSLLIKDIPMSNRKKYVAKLIKIEKLRKKRWIKKIKRAKMLKGRKKNTLNSPKEQ